MEEFVMSVFNLSLFLFDKTDNVIIFLPCAVMFFVFVMMLIRRLMRFV